MCTNFQIVQIQTVISSSLQHLPITRAYGLHFLCLNTLELLIKTHRTEIHCPRYKCIFLQVHKNEVICELNT